MEISKARFEEVIAALEAGQLRVAEKVNGAWKVNREVKEVILAGFKLGQVTDMSQGQFPFFDKDTFPVKTFKPEDGVRIVPGGTSIRRGAVVVSGSKPLKRGPGAGSGVSLYCPVIVKYRDEKTAGSVVLEDLLR